MKKIFLSLPMSGRSDDEIEAQIAEMKAEFLLKNPWYGDEEIIFVHNFEKMETITSTYNSITGMEQVTPALFYLGRAINKMAYCDGIYFGKGWTKARGCMIEYNVALEYGLSRYIRLRDGSIAEMIKPKKAPLKDWDICNYRCELSENDCQIVTEEERNKCGCYQVLKERETRR